MNDDKLKEYILQGFVLYSKNGIIELEQIPQYGEITLSYQDGKLILLTKKETKK
ncbi:hypothetical protein BOVMAS02_14690 [Streptococcus uberis]|uniref:hypothetical protein n=1 Tax=Streptococcus uberis TaxID=1349 RepID=UPI0027DD1428|nr:hypothetical protein [Streptococcus uberis]MCK1192974.1 hypothetical protein [Streptococcus uberis]MCK1244587.1 hypothetical protein [Streptococcus uberis]MCK1246870.1 hypothetical protein [Streptococcus uberis]